MKEKTSSANEIIQKQKNVKRQGMTSDFHSDEIQVLGRLNIKYRSYVSENLPQASTWILYRKSVRETTRRM